jgi:predicted N-acetyltransferase YhbS
VLTTVPVAKQQPGRKGAWVPRLAADRDVPAIERLIERSVRELHPAHYSREQIEASIGTAFGVDRQLIRDRTYFVVEDGGKLVGCGGWSRRASLCGGDAMRAVEDPLLDPLKDPARIRAFFVHPSWVRRGIGSAIMAASERAIRDSGFRDVVIVATLAGVPLYASFGYRATERYEVAVPGGPPIAVVRMEKPALGAVEAPQ